LRSSKAYNKNSMKLIIIHADQTARNHLKQLLNDLDHIVVAESDHPRRLLSDIARQQPHAILVGELATVFTDGTFPSLEDQVALVPVVRIPKNLTGESLTPFLIGALKEVSKYHDTKCLQPYSTDEQRLVLQDDRYKEYAQDEKLGTNLPSDRNAEKVIVVRQIHCARQNHQRARRYLAQVLKTDMGFRPEIAYRLAHGPSYKVIWARDFALKYASVLGFYVFGVEIEYLPAPAPPSPFLDFLSWDASPENRYITAALVAHGFQKGLVPGFCALLNKKYTGQSAEELTNDAIVLLGWCSLLREVARAQVHLMDQILDPASRWWITDQSPKRKTHRAEGLYVEFWGLPFLRQNPSRFRDLAYLCVHEWLSPAAPVTTIAPYRSFFEAYQAGIKEGV
jgi:hypothetical protein